MKRSDDFSAATKHLLCDRAGKRCSNPNCRASTIGPASTPNKTINIGVAAHITAAQPGGPRFDATLASEERKGPDNGIWCCSNCSKLVDSDDAFYTVDLLEAWKRLSEEAARLELGIPMSSIASQLADADLIRFYAKSLDEALFKMSFDKKVRWKILTEQLKTQSLHSILAVKETEMGYSSQEQKGRLTSPIPSGEQSWIR